MAGGGGGALGRRAATALLLLTACLALAPTARAQNDFFGMSEDLKTPPTITWLYPPKGHIKGGTMLTIYGSGFKRSGSSKVRFAIENEFDEVVPVYYSPSEIRCMTPQRNGPGTAHITVANDGMQFSGFPLVYTKGSGTFLKFIFDNSNPGCLDCLNSADGRGLNPLSIMEKWYVDNSTGPYIGGTQVTITARGLDWVTANVAHPYDLIFAGTGQKYNGPVGGPGTPHPHNVDPMSAGNGPPVTGTFYPHQNLKCQWECYLDSDQNLGTGGPSLVPGGPTSGVEIVETSDWINAVWLDYTKVMCESPPMTVPAKMGSAIANTFCKIKVTNNQQTFHDAAFVAFHYQDRAPTVSNIKTHQFSVWPARGPFAGNTEVTVIGTNFLPSKYLKCKFGGVNSADGAGSYVEDDVSHIVGEAGGRVRYISSTEIVCVTPIFGPASQAAQYPSGSIGNAASLFNGTIGSGAILDVQSYSQDVLTYSGSSINVVKIVSGGRGYATPPKITFHGGGGCCANFTATVDVYGAISSMTKVFGGKGYNLGDGAQALATLSTGQNEAWHTRAHQIVVSIKVVNGGSGYRAAPEVLFTCPGGGTTCFQTGDSSDGGPTPAWSPNQHARAVAVLGDDPSCANSYKTCQGLGAVVRVDILYSGEFYIVAPIVNFVPQKPYIMVTPNEIHPDSAKSRNRDDPTQVGYYSRQGKGSEELDPEVAHGSWPNGAESTSVPYDVEILRYPNGGISANGIPGLYNGRALFGADDKLCYKTVADCPNPLDSTRTANDWKSCPLCPELKSPEDRGPLLPPLGKAFMDGSLKPGHQELIRVSNNYHKFGAYKGSDQAQARTHIGYRDQTKNPGIGVNMGYWIWSTSGTSAQEMNRCRVSNNPPVHQFGVLQGHGLDAALGLGTADDEFQLIGSTNNLLYLDGSSVGGKPGYGATAVAVLSDTPANCSISLRCWVQEVVVTNPGGGGGGGTPGTGYMYPPTVTFSGGGGTASSPANGARATAIISGGQVLRVEVDPLHRGISYTTPPAVHFSATRFATAYDGRVENTGHYIAPGATTAGAQDASYKHVGSGVTPNADTVGHGTYTLDQTTLSVHQGEYKQTSNYMVGHGAFPGHPGNQNLGHPRKDCIYFLYSDIYVSPSGSDSTGQGTAGRPYRTIQKCIDSALAGARDFYVYKKADGGDRDPAIPNGKTRYGTESAGGRAAAGSRRT